VERFCSENGLPNSTGFKVRLVLEELVLNLIDHAVGSVTDQISVAVDLQPGRVVLEVEDDGAPFDPRSAPAFDKARPFDEREPRGMGIHLVRSVTESIIYERAGNHNRLQVVITY